MISGQEIKKDYRGRGKNILKEIKTKQEERKDIQNNDEDM